eukprot:203828_1
MSAKALQIYWDHFKSFRKYAALFALGSFVSGVFSLWLTKKITGWNIQQLMWNIMIGKEKLKYRDILHYDGFSVSTSPIRPSTECIAYDSLFRSFKNSSQLDHTSTVKDIRETYMKFRTQHAKQYESLRMLPSFVSDPKELVITQNSVNNNGAIKGYLLEYPGCSSDNGILYYIHGGGFYLGNVKQGYPMLCTMCMYLGCTAFAIDYHFCPEISIPQQVDQIIEGYKYIMNQLHVNADKVFIIGDSCGGTLVLLALQKLNELSLAQPRGGIIISGIVDGSWQIALKTEQEGIKDAFFKVCPAFMDLCIDEEERKEYDEADVKGKHAICSLPKYSPLNGNWKGLCPLYVSASENEVLINDSKMIVEKCREFGVECSYEWDPCLLHVTIVWASYIPEARDKLVLVIQWMQEQLNSGCKYTAAQDFVPSVL